MIIVGQLTANPGRRAEVDIWKRNSPISLRCQFPVLTGCQVVQKNGLTLAVPVAKCGTMGLILWQTIPSIKGSGALYGAHVSTTKLTPPYKRTTSSWNAIGSDLWESFWNWRLSGI
ncbi:hypothetical protein FQN53_005198 [Emmonsiellopsis sp. PD_33]|nr:hypothetical protein FQN53_005198 [Emmonsiellopsis sp. PD_33]